MVQGLPIMLTSNTERQAISIRSYKTHEDNQSICSAEGWRSDNSKLKRPLETKYTHIILDGQPTQANHIFVIIIQEIE